jgi:hypothetical protein
LKINDAQFDGVLLCAAFVIIASKSLTRRDRSATQVDQVL